MKRLHRLPWILAVMLVLGVLPVHADTIILSTTTGATLGSLGFRDGDLVEYNPGTNTATLFFNEDLFVNGNENIDAVFVVTPVPEPGTWLLMGTGLLSLVGYGWKRQKHDVHAASALRGDVHATSQSAEHAYPV